MKLGENGGFFPHGLLISPGGSFSYILQWEDTWGCFIPLVHLNFVQLWGIQPAGCTDAVMRRCLIGGKWKLLPNPAN